MNTIQPVIVQHANATLLYVLVHYVHRLSILREPIERVGKDVFVSVGALAHAPMLVVVPRRCLNYR